MPGLGGEPGSARASRPALPGSRSRGRGGAEAAPVRGGGAAARPRAPRARLRRRVPVSRGARDTGAPAPAEGARRCRRSRGAQGRSRLWSRRCCPERNRSAHPHGRPGPGLTGRCPRPRHARGPQRDADLPPSPGQPGPRGLTPGSATAPDAAGGGGTGHRRGSARGRTSQTSAAGQCPPGRRPQGSRLRCTVGPGSLRSSPRCARGSPTGRGGHGGAAPSRPLRPLHLNRPRSPQRRRSHRPLAAAAGASANRPARFPHGLVTKESGSTNEK